MSSKMKTDSEAIIKRQLIEAKKRGLERLAERVARSTEERIVAYLRDRAQDYIKKSIGLEDTKHAARFFIPRTALEDAALAIERGEHWSTQ